ncbi:PEP-CTERM sorting domain-containing protein [Bythopirellula polymerisocia]|uniref:Ice-binding protein C-terminal domain-containing protein n=1 Tax=Bythopirellula polymerisocia TaxID=2528003 RepID=A0A5C6D3F2_9BACT|nr:PEP-CTERM sorting domain-containing protein [Bythopirellula polymerisocia]TWU29756.1 hypothetical protein Pla144_05350 [Bythopirellula polymerisocia]
MNHEQQIDAVRTVKSVRVFHLSAFLIVAASCQLTHAADFIVLENLSSINSRAYGVSNDGMVVAGIMRYGDPSVSEAFRWTDVSGMVGLGPLPGGDSSGAGENGRQPLSRDGSTIVGYSYDDDASYTRTAFIQNTIGGMQGIDPNPGTRATTANGVSHNGSVVIGTITTVSDDNPEPFRWTEEDGLVGLGHLAGNNATYPSDISDDGAIIVGTSIDRQSAGAEYEVFTWSESNGMLGTGIVGAPDDGGLRPNPAVVSSDGATIAGTTYGSSGTDLEAFRWTADSGVVGLGFLPGTEGENGEADSQVRDMTPDGRLIVGRSGFYPDEIPFVWSEAAGMENFQQVLIDRYGMGDALEGWNLTSIQSVSANGQYFTGWSSPENHPSDGLETAWLIRLDVPWGTTVPEPSSLFLLALGLGAISNYRSGQ